MFLEYLIISHDQIEWDSCSCKASVCLIGSRASYLILLMYNARVLMHILKILMLVSFVLYEIFSFVLDEIFIARETLILVVI